jgi:membrane protein YqaA with SNARE-associated domain
VEPLAAYGSMFAAAFAEATVLPVRSEAVLLGLMYAERFSWTLLFVLASIGNTLGSAVNWALGYFLARLEDRPWYPIRRERMVRAERWYHRWGRWTLLGSWLPFVGDLLTITAGMMREPLPTFMLIVAVTKTVRYALVIGVAAQWL